MVEINKFKWKLFLIKKLIHNKYIKKYIYIFTYSINYIMKFD